MPRHNPDRRYYDVGLKWTAKQTAYGSSTQMLKPPTLMNEWVKSSEYLRRKWSGVRHSLTCFQRMLTQLNVCSVRRYAAIPSRFTSSCAEATVRLFGSMCRELR